MLAKVQALRFIVKARLRKKKQALRTRQDRCRGHALSKSNRKRLGLKGTVPMRFPVNPIRSAPDDDSYDMVVQVVLASRSV